MSKCRGEAAKWQPFQDYFAFYSEPANQKPRLIVSGPRNNAEPTVNDKLRSYTVTACPKFGAPFSPSVLTAGVELRRD